MLPSQKLDEIESEMKRIGYWFADLSDLQASVTRGEVRSYLDAPTFEGWLQTVLLPNARRSVQTDTVPTDSQVGLMAMRQYDYHTFTPEAQNLNKLLHGFDELVRQHVLDAARK